MHFEDRADSFILT